MRMRCWTDYEDCNPRCELRRPTSVSSVPSGIACSAYIHLLFELTGSAPAFLSDSRLYFCEIPWKRLCSSSLDDWVFVDVMATFA